MSRKLKIAVVDDHELFRKGLSLLLKELKGFEVILEATNGVDLLSKIAEKIPDVILMDIKMPLMGGIEATVEVKRKYPQIKVLALTMYNDESIMLQMIEKGANGFLLKNQGIEIIENAIRSVVETGFYFNDDVSKAMLKGLVRENKIDPKFKRLTLGDLEIKIISFISEELSSKEIAQKLDISLKTVENCREKILQKTGARNTAGIVMYAVKNNLINISI